MSAPGPSRQSELFAASVALAQNRRRSAEAAAHPAQEGDLYLLAATVDSPVEWALLERREPAGPFLAVPGDTHPFVGSRDLEVATATNTLHLRGEGAVWLDPSVLEPELRVGQLQPDDLERARRKLREVSREDFTLDPFREDVDASPEYQGWMRDVIRPARAAAGVAAVVLPFRAARRSPGKRLLPGLAAAAAIFLLAALGLAVQALRQRRAIEGLEMRAGSAEAALSAERAQREGAERSAASIVQESEEKYRRLQAQLATRENPPALERPLPNQPVAILQPAEAMRGGADKTYRLPAESPFLVVGLKFRESDSFSRYRVNLDREGSAKSLWSTDELERSPEGGVYFTLPRRLVAPGRYRLRLSGLEAEGARPVGEYVLIVIP